MSKKRATCVYKSVKIYNKFLSSSKNNILTVDTEWIKSVQDSSCYYRSFLKYSDYKFLSV